MQHICYTEQSLYNIIHNMPSPSSIKKIFEKVGNIFIGHKNKSDHMMQWASSSKDIKSLSYSLGTGSNAHENIQVELGEIFGKALSLGA